MTSTTIKDYPQLYKKDKNEKIRMWKLDAIKNNDNTYWISVTYGVKDGKMIHSKKQVKEGKNIGKKNETTVEQQLILVCDKTYKDKTEIEEYIADVNDIDEEKIDKTYAPMLAATWDPDSKVKRKTDIKFPCFVQPKLDGIRCLTYLKGGEIVNQSRQLKYFKNLTHINNELSDFFEKYDNIVLDGELYNHDIEFNNIAGIVKKEKLKKEDESKLLDIKYYIYDCFTIDEPAPYYGRLNFLKKEIKGKKYVELLETTECENKEKLFELHSSYMSDNYEGSILRNKNADYEFTRCKHLQKYKNFTDSEFEIVGYKEGSGHDEGAVIWKCNTKDGGQFDVRPVGSIEERKVLYKNGDKYIGKMLTVKYQELSEYGIPRFPVGIIIRDYE
jgi:ATP-dependent DNA ligase